MSNRYLAYSVICAILLAASLKFGIPIWILFLGLAIYYCYAAFAPRPVAEAQSDFDSAIRYGVLGSYAVDVASPEDFGYGLYIRLDGRPVFIDVREDEHVEKRREAAIHLYENEAVLGERLKIFVASNVYFKSRSVSSIGLHSSDLEQGEVFWEPDGYSLLKGLEFV